jgi:hypothetical protein
MTSVQRMYHSLRQASPFMGKTIFRNFSILESPFFRQCISSDPFYQNKIQESGVIIEYEFCTTMDE